MEKFFTQSPLGNNEKKSDEQANEAPIEEGAVRMDFSVDFDKLTMDQKFKLYDFLNSL